jgi:hypothetical protein
MQWSSAVVVRVITGASRAVCTGLHNVVIPPGGSMEVELAKRRGQHLIEEGEQRGGDQSKTKLPPR